MELASHIGDYEMGRPTRGYEEDGFYGPATVTLFKRLVDQMSADDIKNNQADKYESVVIEGVSVTDERVYGKKNKIVNESAVTKIADKLMDMDYTVFKSLGLRSGGELYSNKMMQKKYVEAMKSAIDKAGIADAIAKNGQAIYDELEDNNYHSTNAFLVLGGYILPKLIGMYKEISKSNPNSTLQPFNESLVTETKVTFHFEEFDNSLHFSDGTIVKIDYDGDFEYRSKWFTTDSDVEKQLNKAFPTEKFIHETTKDK